MSPITFSTETIKITAVLSQSGSYQVTILDKAVCKSYITEWQRYELTAVISMIMSEGGFKSSVDDYLYHIAMRAVKLVPDLALF